MKFFIDTADIYGGKGNSEIFLGKVLGKRRKDIPATTVRPDLIERALAC